MFENLSQTEKENFAFQIIVALRDVMSIAKKTDTKPSYENSIRLLNEVDPTLFEEVIKELPFKNLSDTALFYQNKAELMSLSGDETNPIALIQQDINELSALLNNTSNIDTEKKKSVTQRMVTLEAVKQSLLPRKISENRYLQRDFSKVDRTDIGANFISSDDFVADYKLNTNSFLRLRLLHPDHGEHVSGADLIYEQHNEKQDKFRVMFLQYKIWNDGILYYSQAGNLEEQLRKMKALLCEKGYCGKPQNVTNIVDYRFPYCSAFLRPTDKLQKSKEKLISSGIHIPVCLALQWRDEGETSINKKNIRTSTLNHNIFENLFNHGFIGSRWLSEEEVTRLYMDNNILTADDSLKIYAREIIS